MNGSGSRPVIRQPAAAFYIQAPIFETTVASQSTVKVRWRNGLSGEASLGGELAGGLVSTEPMLSTSRGQGPAIIRHKTARLAQGRQCVASRRLARLIHCGSQHDVHPYVKPCGTNGIAAVLW